MRSELHGRRRDWLPAGLDVTQLTRALCTTIAVRGATHASRGPMSSSDESDIDFARRFAMQAVEDTLRELAANMLRSIRVPEVSTKSCHRLKR